MWISLKSFCGTMSNKKSSSFSFSAFKRKLAKRFSRFTHQPKSRSESTPDLQRPASPDLSRFINRFPSPYFGGKGGFGKDEFVTRSQPNLRILSTPVPIEKFQTSALEDHGLVPGHQSGKDDISIPISLPPKPTKSSSQLSILSGYQTPVPSIKEIPEYFDSSLEADQQEDPSEVKVTDNEDGKRRDKDPQPISGAAIKWDEFVVYRARKKHLTAAQRSKMMSGWSSLCGFLSYKPGGGRSLKSFIIDRWVIVWLQSLQ